MPSNIVISNVRTSESRLKALLPESMELRNFKAEHFLDCFNYDPNTFLYYRGKLFCAVAFCCSNILEDVIYFKNIEFTLVHYCKNERIPFLLLIEQQRAFLLKEVHNYTIEEAITLEEAVDFLEKRMDEIQEEVVSLGKVFLTSLKEIASNIEYLNDATIQRLSQLSLTDCDWEHISCTVSSITLSEQFEMVLFKALLGSYQCPEICRYTTRDALFRILSTAKQSLCSIVGMNDKSECYYVDHYFSNISVTEVDSIPFERQNEYYIISCTSMDGEGQDRQEDNLSMWRMYADNGEGVCLVFEVQNEILERDGYMFAPISYGIRTPMTEYDENICNEKYEVEKVIVGYEKRHPELDFLYRIFHTRIGGYDIRLPRWELWKHFFKDYEYSDEREVRLVYKGKDGDQKKWIQANQIFCPIVEKFILKDNNDFPLLLKKIILGPKFAEQSINVVQINQLILESNLVNSVEIDCVASIIDNYR